MNPPELEDLIERAFDWQNYQGEVFWVRLHEGSLNDVAYRKVHKSDLSLLHPLLPNVIRSLIKDVDKLRGTVVASGPFVRDHYAVLTDKVFRSKHIIDGFQTLSRVWDIKESAVFNKMLEVQGVRVEFEKQDICGPCIPAIAESNLGSVTVRLRDLEEFYPGFAQRWEVVQSLGLSGKDRVKFLLSSTPNLEQSGVEMSHVAF